MYTDVKREKIKRRLHVNKTKVFRQSSSNVYYT